MTINKQISINTLQVPANKRGNDAKLWFSCSNCDGDGLPRHLLGSAKWSYTTPLFSEEDGAGGEEEDEEKERRREEQGGRTHTEAVGGSLAPNMAEAWEEK
ncbi:hypothetical protein EYF80_000356 [Liparis tanakae]|uniref:Uncharacterized protein n=1 Tax=Liparis tanakae TaxID=230148 RepID=A0A4Z2JHE1_9TELE|nr:hypothetical protein EYF80_000356 [Liparis tanakae]